MGLLSCARQCVKHFGIHKSHSSALLELTNFHRAINEIISKINVKKTLGSQKYMEGEANGTINM